MKFYNRRDNISVSFKDWKSEKEEEKTTTLEFTSIGIENKIHHLKKKESNDSADTRGVLVLLGPLLIYLWLKFAPLIPSHIVN